MDWKNLTFQNTEEQLKDQKRQYFSHNVSVCFFVYFLRYVWWKRTQSCPIWHM